MSGAMARQGGHQIAQKTTSTAFPRIFERSTVLPSTEVNFRSRGLVISGSALAANSGMKQNRTVLRSSFCISGVYHRLEDSGSLIIPVNFTLSRQSASGGDPRSAPAALD